jgi:RNA polymerase-interacting CarD/CdnL/TRCF family regulator
MDFHVGDQVVHWSYGLGEIINLEEKELSGKNSLYYVVQIGELTLWVPVADNGKSSLRTVTPPAKFENLFEILRSRGEPLPSDRMERKSLLSERMREGRLEGICEVIRDLSLYKHKQKMNDMDTLLLRRAETFLLNEWTFSLPISLSKADETLKHLLGESLANSK